MGLIKAKVESITIEIPAGELPAIDAFQNTDYEVCILDEPIWQSDKKHKQTVYGQKINTPMVGQRWIDTNPEHANPDPTTGEWGIEIFTKYNFLDYISNAILANAEAVIAVCDDPTRLLNQMDAFVHNAYDHGFEGQTVSEYRRKQKGFIQAGKDTGQTFEAFSVQAKKKPKPLKAKLKR